jgi:1-acyl-sn-glycerol-3-phosphate acyltransferase
MDAQGLEGPMLRLVHDVALELHPGRRDLRCTLDSSLERDLGFDSLGRTELVLRIEHQLGLRISEHAGLVAETPRDLLAAAVRVAGRRDVAGDRRRVIPHESDREEIHPPIDADTLVAVLRAHAQAHPQRTHLQLYSGDELVALSYRDLMSRAENVAESLRERDVQAGDAVALMLPTCREYFESFLGVLLAGAVPVPIYPPYRAKQLEEHLRRQVGILENARATLLVCGDDADVAARFLRARLTSVRGVLAAASLAQQAVPGSRSLPRIAPSDRALLQYTSGSTGDPKGVVLTHANLLANIRAMGEAIGAGPSDVLVSWLPLYHDMGLIGAWLGSLYFGVRLVVMPPTTFLARPSRWLWAIHEHRATLSAAPNFAYELCASRIPDAELDGLDLSSWRMAINGAEPVSPATIRRFQERFGPFGFHREAMAPVYGLAESCVGLAFPMPGRGPRIDRVGAGEFRSTGRAFPSSRGDATLEFVCCGRALPRHEIRVVDAAGRELQEREEGHVQFRGPSATQGYLRNPEANRRLLDHGWLNTGDLGYVAEGELFVTGREKDVIIRGGQHIFPYEIEEAVASVPGIRKGNVAVFAAADPATSTEKLVVLAETRETDPSRRNELRDRISGVVLGLLGAPPEDVVVAPPGSVLKTSSGKIRRAACRAHYEAGEAPSAAPSARRQVLALASSTILPLLRRMHRWLIAELYAAWCWATFGILAAPMWLAAVVPPGVQRRRRSVAAVARALLLALGAPPHLHGARLPSGRAIIASNHASYLDALIMTAVLPPQFAFVAKRELWDKPLMRLALRRLEAEPVTRFEAAAGADDRAHLEAAVKTGKSLVFFPEGTIVRAPGLQPFHVGAFQIAAAAGVPVVPVSIAGSRSMLRPDQWFPRRGSIDVTIGPALEPEDSTWSEALRLRMLARGEILRHCREPDLGEASDFARPLT